MNERKLFATLMTIVGMQCPRGYKPTEGGKTCTDGKGNYVYPTEEGKEHKTQPERSEGEARKVVHQYLDDHFRGRSKPEREQGLKKLLEQTNQVQHGGDREKVQKLRQMKEGIITYGQKHGIKVGAKINKMAIAKELIKVARLLSAMEFDTQDAMNKYLKEHPDANKSKHHVKKQENKNTPEKHENPNRVRSDLQMRIEKLQKSDKEDAPAIAEAYEKMSDGLMMLDEDPKQGKKHIEESISDLHKLSIPDSTIDGILKGFHPKHLKG